MRRESGSKARYALLCLTLLGAGSARHVDVSVVYEPADSPGADAAIAVWLEPLAAEYVVNEEPAPRLSLDPKQAILEDRQPPPPENLTPYDPETARYRDPEEPLRFPVAVAPGAPSGLHLLSAQITFFYCSREAGWCRKGKQKVELAVRVE